MAIDTRAKRQNVAWVGFPGPVSVLPDGSINAADREQISWTYSGISVTPPVVTVLRSLAQMGCGQ